MSIIGIINIIGIRKKFFSISKLTKLNYLLDDSGLVYNVLSEYDDVLNATSIYTYGNDIISIENQGEVSYYIVDGTGSTRALTNAEGIVTDTYTFDAFGNILEQTGNTYNPYLYNQEQFDQVTGLYYLRNRYMNPSTGRFVSMDSYSGSIYDPASLHKYLYANGNPAMYSDPTGYCSLIEMQVAVSIDRILTGIDTLYCNAFMGGTIAAIDTYLGGGSQEEILNSFVNGTVDGFKWSLVSLGLNSTCGFATKAAKIGLGTYFTGLGIEGTIDSIANGRTEQAYLRGLLTAAGGLGTAQEFAEGVQGNYGCFTAGTLVATENGYKPIEEIEAGDYVWSENPVTGEVELKKVLETFIRSKDELIIINIDNEVIETTSEHPFYVEGKGWVRAGDLETGDALRLLTGENDVVDKIETKELGGKVYVYNFEVEDFHTYFVGEDRVLVHNSYDTKSDNKAKILAQNRVNGRLFEQKEFAKIKLQSNIAEE